MFLESFFLIFQYVLQVFLIAFFAGVLVRKQVVKQEQITAISKMTIVVFLPCLFFSRNVQAFRPEDTPNWWIIPLCIVGVIAFGILISSFLFRLKGEIPTDLVAVASFQNAGYLILPLGAFLFAEEVERFETYVFLIILGVSPILWSIGKFLVTSGKGSKISIQEIVTPPLLANVVSLFIVLLNCNRFIPDLLIDPVAKLGQAAIPCALFVLGASLANIPLDKMPPWQDSLIVIFTKFIALPIFVISIFYLTDLFAENILLQKVFVLQASSAPGTNLIIQIRNYGGNEKKVGSLMIVCYLLALFFIPFWLGLFEWGLLQNLF